MLCTTSPGEWVGTPDSNQVCLAFSPDACVEGREPLLRQAAGISAQSGLITLGDKLKPSFNVMTTYEAQVCVDVGLRILMGFKQCLSPECDGSFAVICLNKHIWFFNCAHHFIKHKISEFKSWQKWQKQSHDSISLKIIHVLIKQTLAHFTHNYKNIDIKQTNKKNPHRNDTALHEIHMWGWITMWMPSNLTILERFEHLVWWMRLLFPGARHE